MRWPRFDREHPFSVTYVWAKRIAIALVGGTVLVIGVAMIVLPGPALIVIPLGLTILGLEFAWARRWLGKVKVRTRSLAEAFNRARERRPP